MNANKLADELDLRRSLLTGKEHELGARAILLYGHSADMIRQQQSEIEALKLRKLNKIQALKNKSNTLRIDLEEYRKYYEYRKLINSYDPKDLEIYANGDKINTFKLITEWDNFCGFSTVDFLNEYFMEGREMIELTDSYERGFFDGMAKQRDSAVQGFVNGRTPDSELSEHKQIIREQQAEIGRLKQIIDANNLNQNIGQFVKPANEPYLTDEKIWKLWQTHLNDDITVFARAILKKAREMNKIPDLDSKIRIATQIDFFEKRYWEMIKELHAKNDMLEEQAKEIKQLEVDVEHYADRWRIAIDRANPLYTHPMRELSDEEIWKLWQTHLNDEITVFAKALIKEARGK